MLFNDFEPPSLVIGILVLGPLISLFSTTHRRAIASYDAEATMDVGVDGGGLAHESSTCEVV